MKKISAVSVLAAFCVGGVLWAFGETGGGEVGGVETGGVEVGGAVFYGGDMQNPANWAEGVVCTGAGARVTLKLKDKTKWEIHNWSQGAMSTNLTVGHLYVPIMPDGTDNHRDVCMNGFKHHKGTASPDADFLYGRGDEAINAVQTNSLIFNAGGEEPATIWVAQTNCPKGSVRFECGLPLILQSDLLLRHAGLNGHPGWAIVLAGDIREEGGKRGVIVEMEKEGMVAALGGDNAFTGDVDVRKGVLRAQARFGVPTGREFGVENTVWVTNDAARLDLWNGVFPETQKLVLNSCSGTSMAGGLYNGANNIFGIFAEWKGPVELRGTSKIGGKLTGYPQPDGGHLKISGKITETTPGCGLVVDTKKEVRIEGEDNEFTGGVEIREGLFSMSGLGAVNDGEVVFSGGRGTYRMTAGDEFDISTAKVVATNRPVSVWLDGDFTWNPQGDFARAGHGGVWGIAKTGSGTLYITKPIAMLPARDNPVAGQMQNGHNNAGLIVNTGKAILDYREHDEPLIRQAGAEGTHWSYPTCGAILANCAELEIITKENVQGYSAITVMEEGSTTVRKRGAADMEVGSFIVNARAMLNLEIEEGGVKMTSAGVQGEGSDYPGVVSPRVTLNGEGWATLDGAKRVVQYAGYVTDWSAAGPKSIVDVTPENAGSVPAEFEVSMLRFNTPPADGGTLELNLSGTNRLNGATILVTKNMGNATIVIRGGSLRAKGNRNGGAEEFRVVNHSPGATIKFETQIDYNLWEKADGSGLITNVLDMVVAGSGTVDLGEKQGYQGALCVLGAEAVLRSGYALGTPGANWHGSYSLWQKPIRLVDGGRLTAKGEVDTVPKWTPGIENGKEVDREWFYPVYNIRGAKGGIFNTPEEGHVLLQNGRYSALSMELGSKWTKTGKGALRLAQKAGGSMSGTTTSRADRFPYGMCKIVHAEGTLDLNGLPALRFFSEADTHVLITNNAVLKGAGFFKAQIGGLNGGGNGVETANKIRYEIGEGGATIDLCDGAGSGMNGPWQAGMGEGWLVGSGTLRIINGTWVTFGQLANRDFTGTIEYGFSSSAGNYGAHFQNGIIGVGANEVQLTGSDTSGRGGIHRYGGMKGDAGGVLRLKGNDAWGDHVLCVGRDRDETIEFNGKLELTEKSDQNVKPRLLKVGRNVQRLNGAEGNVTAASTVQAGGLVMGNGDVLGGSAVYVGNGATKAGERPRLLAGAGATISRNRIKVFPVAEGALASVGADAGEAPSAITSEVEVYGEELGLYSGGSEVTISGGIAAKRGDKVRLVKWGPGKVKLEGAGEGLELAGVEGGTLETDGALAIAEGAKVEVNVPDGFFGNRKNKWVLVEAKGGVTGAFGALAEGALPGGWKVVYRRDRVMVAYPEGMTIVVR